MVALANQYYQHQHDILYACMFMCIYNYGELTIKIKQLITFIKWVYSRVAENCTLGYAGYVKTLANPDNKREEFFFYRGSGELGRIVISKSLLD